MTIDLMRALRAMDDDRQLLEQLAVIFSEDAPRMASEFEQAVSRQNSKSARVAIHSLKGLAASFFDHQAVEDFATFEQLCSEENWSNLVDAPEKVFSRIEAIVNDMVGQGLLPKPSSL